MYNTWDEKFTSRANRFEMSEDRICEPEYRSIKIIQCKVKKAKRMKKSAQSLRDMWDIIKNINICIVRVPEKEKEGSKTNLSWIMT